MSEHGSQYGSVSGGNGPDPSDARPSHAGPTSGGPADTGRSYGDADTPGAIEMSPVPFNVTPPADDADRHPPQSVSRTRRVVLSVLLAAGLAGAAVLGTAGWRIASQKDAILTVPDDVAGLRLNNTADAATTADYLRTALTAEVTLDQAVGGVYTDPGDEGRSVLFFGGTGLIWTPERDLETAFDLVEDDAGAVTGLRGVPAGRLGGAMKCGTADDTSGAITVCGWADHGSLALALFPNRSVAEAGPLLRTIREAAQTRN